MSLPQWNKHRLLRSEKPLNLVTAEPRPATPKHSPYVTPGSVRWVILFGGIAALVTLLWFATRPPPLTIQGEVIRRPR